MQFLTSWKIIVYIRFLRKIYTYSATEDFRLRENAKFGRGNEYDATEPVGQLRPNGYGLYDIFGLVEEHVLFEQSNPFNYLLNNYSKESPSCFKGGSIHDNWEYINYGHKSPNYHSTNLGGFRLIRKIR